MSPVAAARAIAVIITVNPVDSDVADESTVTTASASGRNVGSAPEMSTAGATVAFEPGGRAVTTVPEPYTLTVPFVRPTARIVLRVPGNSTFPIHTEPTNPVDGLHAPYGPIAMATDVFQPPAPLAVGTQLLSVAFATTKDDPLP